MNKFVLLVFHPQLDFTSFGALNYELPHHFFEEMAGNILKADEAIAILDAHDGNHLSFAGNHLWRYPGQKTSVLEKEITLFPIHAIKNAFGVSIVPELKTVAWTTVIYKNQHPESTGFEDNVKSSLESFLTKNKDCHLNFGLCGIEHEGVIHSVQDWLITQGVQAEIQTPIYYPEINVLFPPSLSEE